MVKSKHLITCLLFSLCFYSNATTPPPTMPSGNIVVRGDVGWQGSVTNQGQFCTRENWRQGITDNTQLSPCCVPGLPASNRMHRLCCENPKTTETPPRNQNKWELDTEINEYYCADANHPSCSDTCSENNEYCCKYRKSDTCMWQSGSCRIKSCGSTIKNTYCSLSSANHNSWSYCSCLHGRVKSNNPRWQCINGRFVNSRGSCVAPRNCSVSGNGAGNTRCNYSGTLSHNQRGTGGCAHIGTCSVYCNNGTPEFTNNCRACLNGGCIKSGVCKAQGFEYTRWRGLGCGSSQGSVPEKTKYRCIVGKWKVVEYVPGVCVGFGSNSGCFISGVSITMSDGSTKPIQDIKVGDLVLGVSGINKVIEVKKHYARPFKGLVYSINGSKVFVTGGHPFMTNKGWKAFDVLTARELNPTLDITRLNVGDILIKQNNETEVIKEWEAKRQDTKIYNFTADGDKTYYADGYLVHNK